MKKKTCSFCNKEVDKLWYSNPKCCMDYNCRNKYNEAKGVGKNALSQASDGKTYQSRKTRLKPMSAKMAERLKEYRIVRDEYMRMYPNCKICGKTPVELHHKKPRAYFLTDVSIFMSVCRSCHTRIESHDAWARENGYKLNHL